MDQNTEIRKIVKLVKAGERLQISLMGGVNVIANLILSDDGLVAVRFTDDNRIVNHTVNQLRLLIRDLGLLSYRIV